MMSIRRQLLGWLLGTLLLTGLAAGGLTFVVARHEGNEQLDRQLQQLAWAVDLSVPRPAPAIPTMRDVDPEDRYALVIWNADGSLAYAAPDSPSFPQASREGFADVDMPRERWRVYTRLAAGKTLMIGQQRIIRDEIAAGSALYASLPVFLLLPILGMMTVWAIGRSLRGLGATIAEVSNRDAEHLAPLSQERIPVEIAPLLEEMNRLLARLQLAMEAQRRFVADAAHELRTPLAALQVQAQNLQHATAEDDRQERLAALLAGIRRASGLVEKLLEMARQEARDRKQHGEMVDLATLLGQCLADAAPLAARKNIDLGLVGEAPEAVFGDAEALRILFGNLLENALKYTPPDGTVDVRLSLSPAGPRVEVLDSGPGVPEALLERVFDRFFRIEGSGLVGSGLGLSLVQRIAERHQATVRLRNREQGGLAVEVIFGNHAAQL